MRKKIISEIRKICPELKESKMKRMYCDRRTSNHPSNIDGFSIKFYGIKIHEIKKKNRLLEILGVKLVNKGMKNAGAIHKGTRHLYSVQVYKIDQKELEEKRLHEKEIVIGRLYYSVTIGSIWEIVFFSINPPYAIIGGSRDSKDKGVQRYLSDIGVAYENESYINDLNRVFRTKEEAEAFINTDRYKNDLKDHFDDCNMFLDD